MIWALAVLVAGLLALVLAWPLLRSRQEGPAGPAEHDLAVYRDQLAELERDRDRGLIGASEAAGAHAEIARRMIAAGRTRDRETAAQRPAPAWSFATVALVPVAAIAIYAAIGRPGLPAQPASAPQSPAQQAAMIQDMVASLAARLAQAPDDVEGWRRLARARAVLGDMDAARIAAENAVSRAPDNVEILLELADLHAPASPADALSPMFLETLRRVVALQPGHVQSLFFLGMDASQRGDRLSARHYWEKLRAVLPAGAPVATDIKRRLDSLGAAP